MKKRFFITGTDTDVGKTILSLIMLRALQIRNQSCVYLKPVQTGTTDPDSDSDPATIARHLPGGLPGGMRPSACIAVCCPSPKAPLFSDCPYQEQTCVQNLADFTATHDQADFQIIEGAGGLFVPLNGQETMLDLAAALDAEVLLAARAGLGTINHTLLSLEALRIRKISCAGVVLMDRQGATSPNDIRENKEAIEHFSGIPVLATVGYLRNLNDLPMEILQELMVLLS